MRTRIAPAALFRACLPALIVASLGVRPITAAAQATAPQAAVAPASAASSATKVELVAALRRGGLVVVMRHASSPSAPPEREVANADNITGERQLDAAGRAAATAMGQALRTLQIPFGEVVTSPTYRARETARLLGFANAAAVDALGDGGQSMQAVAEAQAAWLRERVTRAPSSGNLLLITHMPNIQRAFPAWGAVADGEAIVLRPAGTTADLLGRIRIEDWPTLR